MSFLNSFPDEVSLLKANLGQSEIPKVNAHIHTPYSFSSFQNIEEAFKMAINENVKILGINDFFVCDGYSEFESLALKNRIFPLFNIEFIGLHTEAQKNGIRINDPNNPGRIYISGKGLKNPFKLRAENDQLIKSVILESQEQVKAMITKANQWFLAKNIPIVLDFEKIKTSLTKELVRERHIAKAVRLEMEKSFHTHLALQDAYFTIFDGKPVKSAVNNYAAIENEIRSNLLKAGGPAFVPETEASFPEIEKLIEIIKDAGGIPCYPVLLDDAKGFITEFESDFEKLAEELKKLGILSIELIPNRNDFDVLEKFVRYFDEKGFIVMLGTEHNSPDLFPLTPVTRGNKPLDDYLNSISYKSACVIAAHQYRKEKGQTGLQDSSQIEEFRLLGKKVIEFFLSN